MLVDVLISRARSALDKGTVYKSPGVVPPLDASTWPESGAETDCSGFLTWCLRISRKIDHPGYKKVNGGWFETTGIYADGMSSWGFCDRIDAPRPGCFIVYPDYKDSSGKSRDGHIGLVTATNGKPGMDGVTAVIHCSLGNSKKGDAIRETDAKVWLSRPESIAVWWMEVTE